MTNEEKISELEKQVAILKAEADRQREENKELKKEHKELREKHEKLNDEHGNHKSRSQLLHVASPILIILIGYIVNFVNKVSHKEKVKELLTKIEAVSSNNSEEQKTA